MLNDTLGSRSIELRPEINLVVAAVEEGVTVDLRTATTVEMVDGITARFRERRSLSPDAAHFAVDAWADTLRAAGLSSAPVSADSTPLESAEKEVGGGGDLTAERPESPKRPERVTSGPAPAVAIETVHVPAATAKTAPPAPTPTPTNGARSRKPLLIGVACLAAIALVAVGAIALSQGGDDSGNETRARPVTTKPFAARSFSLEPIEPGVYSMSGTRSDTRSSSPAAAITVQYTDDVPTTTAGVQHQVLHVHRPDGSDTVVDTAYQTDGLDMVHQTITQANGQFSWDWVPAVRVTAFPLRVGSSWTYAGEGKIAETSAARRVEKLSGTAAVSGAGIVTIGGKKVPVLIIDRTQTIAFVDTVLATGASTTIVTENDTIREYMSPEHGFLLKSHVSASVNDTSTATPTSYVIVEDLTIDDLQPKTA